MSMTFHEALSMGRSGEIEVAEKLEALGCFVIPSYDYSGKDGDKAPKMRRGSVGVVVPDLDACKDGYRAWVEVKTKTEPTLYRKTDTWCHGINKRHWDEYKKVQDESGCDVFLCIVERSTNAFLIQSVDELSKSIRYGFGGGSHMVYFPRDAFDDMPETDTGKEIR